MEPRRFDAITKTLAGRFSRRAALQSTGVGLAASLAGATPLLAHAQDATPVASPEALGGGDTRTYFLFVQVASGGTLTPKAGEEGVYTLVLEHGVGETVYFSDRPERIVGTVPTTQFLDALGFTPTNPPNAALVAGDEVVVIELLNPVIDEAAGTLTYDVRVLDAYEEEGLAHLATQSTGRLPESFGSASLFIDDCPDVSGCLNFPANARDSHYVGPLPDGVNGGQCYDWGSVSCNPCNGWSQQDYENACNAAYAECNNLCFVDLGGP
ncbi:MAG: hypothetical protein M3457_10695 [Chloroflexota bacterium]|nr:hypothetical protein [Chloroflexota bacterium]